MQNKDLHSRQAQNQKSPNTFLRYSGLAMQMVVTIGLLTYLGFRIDGWLELKFPVFLLVLSMGSLFGIIYKLLRAVK